jgi:hypothetical protein
MKQVQDGSIPRQPPPEEPVKVLFALPAGIYLIKDKEVIEKKGPLNQDEKKIFAELSDAWERQYPSVDGNDMDRREQGKWDELVPVIQSTLPAYRKRHQILTAAHQNDYKSRTMHVLTCDQSLTYRK